MGISFRSENLVDRSAAHMLKVVHIHVQCVNSIHAYEKPKHDLHPVYLLTFAYLSGISMGGLHQMVVHKIIEEKYDYLMSRRE